jgi:hypothetical protein
LVHVDVTLAWFGIGMADTAAVLMAAGSIPGCHGMAVVLYSEAAMAPESGRAAMMKEPGT